MARGCPSLGCGGDPRYAAPGRGHVPGCKYPLDVKPEDVVPDDFFDKEESCETGPSISTEQRDYDGRV